MTFRNAFKILTDNFRLVYKLLGYQLIIICLTGSIFLGIFIPNTSNIVEQFMQSGAAQLFVEYGKEILHSIMEGAFTIGRFNEMLVSIGGAMRDFISTQSLSITLIAVFFFLLYIVNRFLLGIGEYVVGDMLNTKLSSYAEVSFFSSFVKNLGRAVRFLLIYVPVSFAFDVLTVGLTYLVFFLILSFLPGVLALFLSVTAIVFAQAFKLTFTSNLMPCMIEGGMGIRDAAKTSFLMKKNKLIRLLSTYTVYIYVVVIVNLVAAIFTFGSALLVSVPASWIWLLSLRFVDYYTNTGRKYFISYDTIVLNQDLGESERFFGTNEMYEKTKMQ